MNAFGHLSKCKVKFQHLSINETPFELFQKLYTKYEYVFILESLTGPREMSEMSILGFDPMLTVTVSANKLLLTDSNGRKDTYEVDEPLQHIRELMP